MKAHKFRLYPSRAIEQKMLSTLEVCRQAYNVFLGELNEQDVIDKALIQGIIPDMKICDARFKTIHSKTLQYEVYKLFSNLSGLAKTKGKRKVGALRFKGKGWFKTFTYNQSGFALTDTGKRCQSLWLSKIGDIPIRCHREVKGNVKQITVKHEQSGRWYAHIITDEKREIPQRKIVKVVGIDVGLTDIVYDSDGNSVSNPRHLRRYSEMLTLRQRNLSSSKKGSKNRMRRRIKVARLHEKITDTRNDFLHKLSHYYVTNYDAIGMEDMPMSLEDDCYAKSKSDVSWGRLRQFIAYKAANAGKLFVPVNYKGTTQRCSQCGTYVWKDITMRQHSCPQCGFVAPRDYNSALEIKRLTLRKIGLERPKSTPVEMAEVVPSWKQEASSSTLGIA